MGGMAKPMPVAEFHSKLPARFRPHTTKLRCPITGRVSLWNYVAGWQTTYHYEEIKHGKSQAARP